jgi:Skp family chaperone for outer membrane proteins
MKTRIALTAASAVLALAVTTGTAFAQQAAAAPATQLSGPPDAGLCFCSDQELVGGSKLGKYIMERVNMLGQQANAEITTTRDGWNNDVKAYEGQKASLPVPQQQQKELELSQRRDGLGQLLQTRQQEIQITREKALARLGDEMQPLFGLVAKERNCSIVLGEAAVIDVSPAMDITPAIIQRLDAKITEFAFVRANLQDEIAAAQARQGGAPAAGAAPAQARPASTPARPRR